MPVPGRTLTTLLSAIVLGMAGCSTSGRAAPSLPFESTAVAPSATPIPAAPIPDSVRLLCDGASTVPAVPVVQARADGVHVEVLNISGAVLSLQVDRIGGDNAPTGLSTTTWEIPPGEARFRCQGPDLDAGRPEGWVTVLVVDPAGHFAGARCAKGVESTEDQ